MDKFFNPRSVVIVGASNSPFNLGSTICKLLRHIDYAGKVCVVNPRGEPSHDYPGFSAVEALPECPDLAVIIIQARLVPETVRACGVKGIRRFIIQSAGFAEEGPEGRRLQAEVDEIAGHFGMRFIGPNCLGLLDAHSRFCCLFGGAPEKYGDVFAHPGTCSYIVQSGGVGALILESMERDVTKINKLVSIGNKADIDEADLLAYFASDNTEVIGMYLENVRQGTKLLQTARRVRKPILVYKVGRTEAGARAALSHTAGMANNDVVFENACRQGGLIRVQAISELFSLPKIFTTMPPLKGRRIAVISNTGALGGITADLLVSGGLEMARLSEDVQSRLRKVGQLYNAANPIDLGPALNIQTFLDIYEILLSSDSVDGLLPIPNVWQDFIIDATRELVAMCREFGKPAAIYIPNTVEKILDIRSTHQIPVFLSPEEAVRALVVSHEYSRALTKKLGVCQDADQPVAVAAI